MNTLADALYAYALEHRIDIYLQQDGKELTDTQWMLDQTLSALRAIDAQTADYAQRMESGQGTLVDLHRRAGFLAGLSVGLELGRA